MTPTRSRRLVVAAVAGVGLLLLTSLGGFALYRRFTAEQGPPHTNEQRPAPALEASSDAARGEIVFVESGGVVSGPGVDVAVAAPPGASEMQVGLDPTFATTPWVPVAASYSLDIHDVGYQMLFGRFRAAPAAEPSPVSVDGIVVDPTYAAATSSIDGLHRPSWVRPLSRSAIVVRIEAGRLHRGLDDDHHSMVGRPIDGGMLDGGGWQVSSEDDPAFGSALDADAQRSARPLGSGLDDDGEVLVPLVHDIVLQLPTALTPGRRYTLSGPEDLVEPIEFIVDPDVTVSPLVQVNQHGYHPGDETKVGSVGGQPYELREAGYEAGTPFRVLATESGSVVHSGVLTARPGGDELGRGDLTGSRVYEFDLSPVSEPGRYRVCVDGVGCSEEFPVDPQVWDDMTVAVARAMYHQRSGVALGPPFTPIGRPRPYHPDDGMVVVESSYRLLDTVGTPLDELFVDLMAGRTDTVLSQAWGGHFDAGDWDRRIEHLYYVRAVVELVDLHPERFGELSVGIPESTNDLPDLLDEGLWTLDLFRRLQHQDGSVPGGIEAAEHPQPGSTSWSDTLAVAAYRPDPFATYVYAGVAAQASVVVRNYDTTLAQEYLDSAVAAMEWAEAQPLESISAELVTAHRSVAAAALLYATGEERWHDVFTVSTTLGDGTDRFLSCHEHTRCDAGWLYLRAGVEATDPALRSTIEQSFEATADEIVAAAATTAYGWTVENPWVPLIWGLGVGGAPKTIALMRAFELTANPAYLEASQRSATVSLGANPTNTVFVTGVGRNPVRHPLIVDTINGGLPVWRGTPVYGNHELQFLDGEEWVEEFVLGPANVDPLPTELPYLWQWMDIPNVAMFNEYTVHQSHAAAIYTFGLLAAAADNN